MDPIERLSRLFEKFPGIGPRQAQRFVQFLLRSSPSARRELIDAIQHLGGSVRECPECLRHHAGSKKVCALCSDAGRDVHLLAVVANDADLSALEKSGTYHGRYFVLGGTLHLGSEQATGLHLRELLRSVPARLDAGLEELILAFPANPEGDATAARLHAEIQRGFPALKVTMLGRGLSTGSELEYADHETLKSAFENRR